MVTNNKKQLTLWLDEAIVHRLGEEAVVNGMSKSQVANSHLQSCYKVLDFLTMHETTKTLKLFEAMETEQKMRKLMSLHYFFKSAEDFEWRKYLDDLTTIDKLRKVIDETSTA